MAKHPIPAGYTSVTPYLYIRGAAEAIEFYKRAFNVTTGENLIMPDGRIGHAEIQLGNARIMLADEFPEMNIKSPATLGGTSAGLMIYVEDVDTAYPQAIAAGCKEVRPLQDQFYGDRSGTLEDPFGHRWTLGSHIEDVSPEEMKLRMAKTMK